MRNRTFIFKKNADHSGIDITWTKTAQRIDISAWHDSCVGIKGGSMYLREFFDALGITEKDCRKAFKKVNYIFE